MDMKKICLAVIVAAALLSVVLAADLPKDPLAAAAATPKASATTPTGSAGTTTSSAASPTPSSATGTAHAPSPSSAASTMPVVGSLAGAFLMAFFGYFLQ